MMKEMFTSTVLQDKCKRYKLFSPKKVMLTIKDICAYHLSIWI